MKLKRNLVIAAMSLVFVGTGFTGVAVASGGSEAESPGDQARQDAACNAAGIPPSATNIDYDDETGVCQLDTGGDEGGED